MKKTILHFILILFSLVSGVKLLGSNQGELLIHKGDSLFSKKKYIEAGEIFEKALFTYNFFTPQVILKLAYINEGLHNNASALYYLSLYRKYFPDLSVEEKIVKLADEKSIPGYSVNFYSTLRNSFYNFYKELIYGTLIVSMLWFLRILFLYRKKKSLAFVPTAFFMTFLVLSGCLINYDRFLKNEAIVFENQPLVMNAPSSGASLVSQPIKGTKVAVLQKKDIWSEIELNNRKVFIRSKALREI